MRCPPSLPFRCHGILAILIALPITAFSADPEETPDAFQVNRSLGRGINLGNALEAPAVGQWGMEIESQHIKAIADAGFDSVRLPVRWSAHAQTSSPYRIDDDFFSIVDDVINDCLKRDLAIVLNFHHYEEMYADPAIEQTRFLGLWKQVAQRYRERSSKLVFEILNEPNDQLDNELWNELFPRLLAVIRKSNPNRAVIVGPGDWNNVDQLAELVLPEEDRMLIGTFHYYNPFHFTHQQAGWVEGSSEWKDLRWNAAPEEVKAVTDDFDKAEQWSKKHNRPLFVGEFGVYSAADLASRARWTATVASEARKRGFSFAYWEFGAGFGAYDRDAGKWNEPLKNALVPAK